MKSLVVFDLDGTLVDTAKLIFDSFNFVLKRYQGTVMSPEEIRKYFGPPEDIAIKKIMGETNFEQIWEDYLQYYRSHLFETAVFPGIVELLTDLKTQRIKLAVFTGKGNETTELTLAYHGLRDFFDMVVTGSIVKNHKPDREGLELIMNSLGVGVGEAVLVGDSIADYKAAAAAGIDFVAALYDSNAVGHFSDIKCKKAESVESLRNILFPKLKKIVAG
ncbi:MAG: HAD family hydrolase [Candidatus Kryptoniota bacterium]